MPPFDLARVACSVLVIGSLAAGCASGGDGPTRDAGPRDAFAEPGEDGGANDAGEGDAGVLDDAGSDDAGTDDSGMVGSVGAPVVSGEPRADHRRPSWTWTLPAGATAFRARIDAGPWIELAAPTTRWLTAPEDLADGVHAFEVQARDAAGLYGPSGTFETEVALVTREGDHFWRQARTMATSPHGHACAISAHNAYSDDLASAGANLTETLRIVHAAQSAGADLIELDLVDVGGEVRVDHDDTGSTARAALADVLADPALRAGDQILFLEIKETAPTEASVRRLLDRISAHRDALAHDGRHVVLRAFHAIRANLDLARTLLDSPEYVLIRPYVRLSVLFGQNAATPARIQEAVTNGYDMIELEYRSAQLMAHSALARSLGLGVNVFTVPVALGEVFVANARDAVDAITVDYPIASARAVVEVPNGLFHLDVSQVTDASATSVASRRTGRTTFPVPVGAAGQPLLTIGGATDPLPGGRLALSAAAMRAATLYDADLPAGEGVFLTAVVRFGATTIADGTTSSVLAKSEAAGWALELFDAAGAAGTVLRFGVYVGGSYRYATLPATGLSTTRSTFITCAYDGDGGVRMWIDNDDAGVTVVSATGGIVNNDVPATIGADPQADGSRRFFFDGEIQSVSMQSWGAH